MEWVLDAYLAIPFLFTLLSVLLASLYLKFRASDAGAKDEAASHKVEESNAEEKPKSEAGEEGEKEERKPEGVSGEPDEGKEKPTVEEVGPADTHPQGEQKPESGNQLKPEATRPEETIKKEDGGVEITKKPSEDVAEIESTKTSLPRVTDDGVEYHPGKIQQSSYGKTLTKEQVEEEQRVELTPDLTSV